MVQCTGTYMHADTACDQHVNVGPAHAGLPQAFFDQLHAAARLLH